MYKKTTKNIQKLSKAGQKQYLSSGVGVGKYRAHYDPRTYLTADINNNKESPPVGGLANIFVARKEINADESDPPTGEVISAMVAAMTPKKKI